MTGINYRLAVYKLEVTILVKKTDCFFIIHKYFIKTGYQ